MNKNPANRNERTMRHPSESPMDRFLRRNAHKPMAITNRLMARINTGRVAYTREA